MPILIAAGAVLLFLILPAAVLTIKLFSRKRTADFDQVPPDFNWSTYLPYRSELLSAISSMRVEPHEEVETESDGAVLKAEFYYRGFDRTAILMHGYCSTPMNNCAIIGSALLKRGYNLLLVHQRAHNRSEGRFTFLGSKEQYDLLKWIEWTEHRVPTGRIVLYGVSMGAAAIGFASDKIKTQSVRAMVLDCCIASPYCQMTGNGKAIRMTLLPVILLIGLFARLFIGLNIRSDMRESLKNTRIPALFIGGSADAKSPARLIEDCRSKCCSESELMMISGAPHALTFAQASDEERERVLDFLEKHINT